MTELDELIRIFTEISTEEDMAKIFQELFTDAEREDFASRYGLMKDLKSGMSQRTIAKKRQLGLCKITRGSKELKKEGSVFNKVIDEFRNNVK